MYLDICTIVIMSWLDSRGRSNRRAEIQAANSEEAAEVKAEGLPLLLYN